MSLNYDSALAIYEPTLGLEVHVELNTKSKMFCGCATEFGAQPNTQTCPVCLGLPGSLPVVNKRAIESSILIGLALNCSIAPFSRFVDVETDEGNKTFRVEIERVHMEEDTGKSLHVGGATGRIHGADHSLLDYNRAGIPLVEIVTKIVPNTGKYAPLVARAYVATLRDILRALKVSDVKMEQGSLRCDVNLSLSKIGSGKLGTRSETKNVNSLRSVERAVTGEIIRHANRLESGEKIVQETRHFLEESGETRPGRSKEQAEDYRYFPEPDLVPVVPDAKWIEELRTLLPEKPADRRKRLQTAWAVPDKEMNAMVNAELLDTVEQTVLLGADPTKARSWWLGEISRIANDKAVSPTDLINVNDVAQIIELISKGELTDKLARQVVEGVIAKEGSPSEVISKRGLKVVSDDSQLMKAIEAAIAAAPDTAEKVRGGNIPAAGALIGAVMKLTGGQADAAKVRELLLKHLGQ
jgi:aspartyl-tRNA(Asn)/glutamyl-tRNA(Gln) amidotransferase subunit B